MKSIVIVEDHPVMRRGLAAWFAGTGRWQVLGVAASLDEARALLSLAPAPPDIVLLDIQLKNVPHPPQEAGSAADGAGFGRASLLTEPVEPEESLGLDLIPWLRERFGRNVPAVTVYTQFDDYAHVNAALSYGARGYVCKYRGEAELEDALLTVLRGGDFVDRAVEPALKRVTNTQKLLTRREAEILGLVKDGLSNKRIAARLNISIRTVENLLSCIYFKTGIASRHDLQKL